MESLDSNCYLIMPPIEKLKTDSSFCYHDLFVSSPAEVISKMSIFQRCLLLKVLDNHGSLVCQEYLVGCCHCLSIRR